MIEFIVMVVAVLFFLFFMLSTAMLLTISDFIEYATFMAARTYKAGFSSEARQRENARIVFDSYFKFVQGLARKPNLEFYPDGPNQKHDGGVIASYEMDLFYIPPLFVLGETIKNRVTLNAEAHLGRDPTFEEVRGYFSDFLQKNGINDPGNLADQMDDNGY